MKKTQYKEYTEVLAILNSMEEEYLERVPQELITFLDNNKDENYKFEVDFSVPLKEQKINLKSLALLAMININYWCKTEDEKKRLIEIYSENENKKREQNRNQYNLSNFRNNKSNEIINTSEVVNMGNEHTVALVEKKEKIYTKIWNIIKSAFRNK